jgi:aconitate hydratase
MTRANGEVVKFPVLCRLDTSAEVEVYKAGGILQKFAKDVIASSKK